MILLGAIRRLVGLHVLLCILLTETREIGDWHWPFGQDGGIDRLAGQAARRGARRRGAVEIFERCHGLQNASWALQDLWSKGPAETVRRYSARKKLEN